MRSNWLLAACVVLFGTAACASVALTLTGQVTEGETGTATPAAPEPAGAEEQAPLSPEPASVEQAAPTRSTTERPHRPRGDERDRLEQESARANAIGNEIERLQESAADAGVDVSFEELKAQAEAKLFQASESYGHAAAPEGGMAYPDAGFQDGGGMASPGGGEHDGGGMAYPSEGYDVPGNMGGPSHDGGGMGAQYGYGHANGPQKSGLLQRVCFRSDKSVTKVREECDTDQSKHFGFQPQAPSQFGGSQGMPYGNSFAPAPTGHEFFGEEQGNPFAGNQGGHGYDIPSYDDVSGYMNQQFAPPPSFTQSAPLPFSQGHPSPFDGHDEGFGEGDGGSMESFMPQMTPILRMMDMIMNEKLPQVFALFEGAGLDSSEARKIFDRARALFAELRGPCEGGDMKTCFRLEEVADIMEGMRPLMENTIMEAMKSGRVEMMELGMQIGKIMEGTPERRPKGGMMNGGGGYGPPPGMMNNGYGPPSGMMNGGGYGPPPGMMNNGYGPDMMIPH